MKVVMLSIQPKWCEKIASGEKTVEVRKTRPKIETPFLCYIYCTRNTPYNPVIPMRYENPKGNIYINGKKYAEFLTGKVIGEFVCDNIEDYSQFPYELDALYRHIKLNARIDDYQKIAEYLGYQKSCYGIHISNLIIYDTPKALSEFFKACDKPPLTDCSKCIDQRQNVCKPLSRPPQSWCYVEVQA